jgi:pSer/pThr/pTyr-binding forkhead associated (FHA) protein
MPEISIQTADGAKERYSVVKTRVTIGRSRESDIFLPDQWLSRHHAEIRRKGETWFIVDLNSKIGTLLMGQPAKGEVRLRPGDVITLGEHTLTYAEGASFAEEVEEQPEGTRVFSARELSDISTKPAIDPTDLARQNRVLTSGGHESDHRPLADSSTPS